MTKPLKTPEPEEVLEYLKRIREEVGSWPEWKQDLLGWRYSKKKAFEQKRAANMQHPTDTD